MREGGRGCVDERERERLEGDQEVSSPAVYQEWSPGSVVERVQSSEEGEERPGLLWGLMVQPACEVHVLHCEWLLMCPLSYKLGGGGGGGGSCLPL